MVERRPPKPEVEGSSPSSPAREKTMNKIINYFKKIRLEMKKVVWLNKKQLSNSTFIVFVFALIVGLFLFVADVLIGSGMDSIYSSVSSFFEKD